MKTVATVSIRCDQVTMRVQSDKGKLAEAGKPRLRRPAWVQVQKANDVLTTLVGIHAIVMSDYCGREV